MKIYSRFFRVCECLIKGKAGTWIVHKYRKFRNIISFIYLLITKSRQYSDFIKVVDFLLHIHINFGYQKSIINSKHVILSKKLHDKREILWRCIYLIKTNPTYVKPHALYLCGSDYKKIMYYRKIHWPFVRVIWFSFFFGVVILVIKS